MAVLEGHCGFSENREQVKEEKRLSSSCVKNSIFASFLNSKKITSRNFGSFSLRILKFKKVVLKLSEFQNSKP